MNKCIFIGNLTRDPEFQTTGSGVSLCRFSIAVNRTYANVNGERETDFINIVTWRGLADNCSKYLFKGSKVCVVGSLQNRTYEDKDGNKRYATDIVAEDVEFISPKNTDGGSYSGSGAGAQKVSAPAKKVSELEPVDTDDLPF
ncbi:MAG: single-stranded DNA-binding protein [Christensenellales bacterium]